MALVYDGSGGDARHMSVEKHTDGERANGKAILPECADVQRPEALAGWKASERELGETWW